MTNAAADVRFSNRPFGVKRFQAGHRFGFKAARGLVLLFGIGTKALPSWVSKTRWNNLSGGLAVSRTAGPSGRWVEDAGCLLSAGSGHGRFEVSGHGRHTSSRTTSVGVAQSTIFVLCVIILFG
jgi:hypothetical protein